MVKESSPVSTVSSDIVSEDLFAGDGEMRAIMRSFDWASSALGSPETWSPTLRTMSRMLLSNSFPMLLWWGPDFIQLYNDAYIPVLGEKHPHRALGKPFRQCWSEVFHVLGPLAEVPFRGGPPTWIDDIPVELSRYAYKEEAHFTISYSPVPDPSVPGGIGGVIAIVNEISAKIVGDRRILALRDLASRAAEAKSAEEACAEAAITLASYRKDAPFVLVYLLDEKQGMASLAGRAETGNCSALCPENVDLQDASAKWPFQDALARDEIVVVDDLAERFGRAPSGPWSDPPASAAVVPIQSQIPRQLAGFLVVGISSRLQFDNDYRGFLELASGQMATSIANARAYEMERRRNEALAELDRAKTTFFSNISHELRTPLTLISGPIEDLLAQSSAIGSDERERLELAHRNSLRMLKLVNTLLDFSRIEAGRLKARFERVDLPAITADLVSVFRAATERVGIALTVECATLSQPAFVDRDMWERIMLNLLSNALKSTFDGQIAVRLREQDGRAVLTVSDTGTGIPPEQIPHIFERFRRVEGARKRTNEGSGIGLALVHELVALHQGTISVASEMGAGSTFTVSLPLGMFHLSPDAMPESDPMESAGGAAVEYIAEALGWLPDELRSISPGLPESGVNGGMPVSGPANLPGSTVLLVDDNRDMRTYVKRLLQARFKVITASNGREALNVIGEQAPDLVLTDVMMPEMDGFELLEKLRTNPETSTVPVIMLSARAGEESRVEGLLAGADDYLVKPFTARELVARVESHVRMARLRRDAARRESELQQAIQGVRKQVAEAVEFITDGFWTLDPAWRITYMNLAAERLSRGTRESKIGQCLWDIFPGIVGTEWERQYRLTMDTRQPVEFHFHYAPWDRWFWHRVYPSPEGGIIAYVRDVTDSRLAEDALRRAEQLATAGRLAASIAHELNNPLEAVTNLLYLCAHDPELPAQSKEMLGMADRELRRLTHIASMSLKFYRQSSAPSQVSIEEILDRVLYLNESRIRSLALHVQREYAPGSSVICNAGEIQQVLANLVANAIDSMSSQGRLRLRIRTARIRREKETIGIAVTIADTGRGIDKPNRARIFEPFFTTKMEFGTGLGLWVVRNIIEKHQGSIRFSSAQGKGTVFRFVLPFDGPRQAVR